MSMPAREDVERLAREVMGWQVFPSMGYDLGVAISEGHQTAVWRNRKSTGLCISGRLTEPSWNPFTDANADVQVLERVRETWGVPTISDAANRHRGFRAFTEAVHAVWRSRDPQAGDYGYDSVLFVTYRTGDYARAALHVLNTENA